MFSHASVIVRSSSWNESNNSSSAIKCPPGCFCSQQQNEKNSEGALSEAAGNHRSGRRTKCSPQPRYHGRMNLKKYRKLSVAEKLEVLTLVDQKKSYSFITANLGIARSTISDIVRRRDLLYGATNQSSSQPHKRMSRFSEVNDHMTRHILNCQAENIRLKSSLIRLIAKRYATSIGLEEFRASKGWYTRLQKRLAKSDHSAFSLSTDTDSGNVSSEELNFAPPVDLRVTSQEDEEEQQSSGSGEYDSEWFPKVQQLMGTLKQIALVKGTMNVQTMTLQLEHEFIKIRCQELSEEIKLMDPQESDDIDWIREDEAQSTDMYES